MNTNAHRAGSAASSAPPNSRALLTTREAVVEGTHVRGHATNAAAWEAEIIVGVALHNQAQALPACLDSIAVQRCARRIGILIMDDASSDDWMTPSAHLLEQLNVVVIRSPCGTAARARNRILSVADEFFPHARWIARLDADDRLTEPGSLAAACELGERSGVDYVLGGNRLRQNGTLLEQTNPATEELLDCGFVLNLLERMGKGTAKNELCSCNLVLARGSGFRYPDVASAEDHWLVADLLINHPDRGAILSTPFYCDYTLNGSVTRASLRAREYLRSRQALHRAARLWASNAMAQEIACS